MQTNQILNGYHTSQNIVPFWIQPALRIMAPFNCINHEWFANTCSTLSRKLLINNLMQSCMPNSFTYFKQKWKVQNGLRLSIVFSNYMYIWTVKHNNTHWTSDSLYSYQLQPSTASPPQLYDHFQLHYTVVSATWKRWHPNSPNSP